MDPFHGLVFDGGRFDTGNKLDWLRATVEVAGASATGVRARLELRCGDTRIATRPLAQGMKVVSIDRPNLGPAEECAVTVTNTGGTARAFALSVRLSVRL